MPKKFIKDCIFTFSKKNAFTLAEILITLGIIGVVAAMTIPTLIGEYQERSFNTAATVFERKLAEALKIMNTQSTLAGHNSTESFVEELSHHIKITKICKNDELMNCFEEEVFWGSGTSNPNIIDMNIVKTSKNFGQKEWQESNVIGIQFANGTNALIAYNKDATQDPSSNQIISISGISDGKSGSVSLGTTALAILYDTNGAKAPNQSTKDLRSINVTKLSKGCLAEANGVCVAMTSFAAPPITKDECEALKSTLGIQGCSYGTDYWAGAAKACGGVNKIASMEDIGKIAAYIYNVDSIGALQNISSGLTFDKNKAAEVGLPTVGNFYLWSNDETSPGRANYRAFGGTNTAQSGTIRSNSILRVLCIGD